MDTSTCCTHGIARRRNRIPTAPSSTSQAAAAAATTTIERGRNRRRGEPPPQSRRRGQHVRCTHRLRSWLLMRLPLALAHGRLPLAALPLAAAAAFVDYSRRDQGKREQRGRSSWLRAPAQRARRHARACDGLALQGRRHACACGGRARAGSLRQRHQGWWPRHEQRRLHRQGRESSLRRRHLAEPSWSDGAYPIFYAIVSPWPCVPWRSAPNLPPSPSGTQPLLAGRGSHKACFPSAPTSGCHRSAGRRGWRIIGRA